MIHFHTQLLPETTLADLRNEAKLHGDASVMDAFLYHHTGTKAESVAVDQTMGMGMGAEAGAI